MNISIFGLGYVGTVSAACFANEGHDVIGIDVNNIKVDIINSGKTPIIEKDLDNLVNTAVKNGKLKAHRDSKSAVLNSEVSFIAVGTPSKNNGSLNLDYIFSVIGEISKILIEKNEFHTIAIRSTIIPGTVDKCIEIVEDITSKKHGTDFGIVSNPEFLREGNAIYDFYNPPYTIIGTTSEKAESKIQEIYSFLDAPFYCYDVKVAEIMKYANNSFHALKIAFANEIGAISKELDIDSHKVMDLVAKDTKLNISPAYLKPGAPFGGSCLPKDLRALSYKAKELDVEVPLLSGITKSNKVHLQRCKDIIQSKNKNKIGVLGLTFKEDTDDLRESPAVEIVEYLIGKGYDIKIFDENISLSFLTGTNREFIDKQIPHFSKLFYNDVQEVINNSEIILIGNKSQNYYSAIKDEKDKSIVDLIRLSPELVTNKNYTGLAW